MDGIRRLGPVDGEHPFPAGVVLKQRHGLVQIHLQAVLDDGFGVVRAPPPGEQPAHELLACDVEVNRGLHFGTECTSRGEGRLGLLDGAREPVEDIAAGLGRGGHGLAQHVHHDVIGNQIALVNVGLGRLPERRPVLDMLSQQVAAGDMGNAEMLG